MVRRFGRQLGKRPITSNKEIVDITALIVAGGTGTDVDLLTQVNDYTGTVGTCPLGASLLGFYLEVSSNNVDNIIGRTDWYLCKREGGEAFTSFPTPGATGGTLKRRWIYHEEKGIFPGAPTTAGGQSFRTKQFIAIPKTKRRMAEADNWSIRVGSSENYSFCVKCIYKWYI